MSFSKAQVGVAAIIMMLAVRDVSLLHEPSDLAAQHAHMMSSHIQGYRWSLLSAVMQLYGSYPIRQLTGYMKCLLGSVTQINAVLG